jgi:cell division protein FtsB
MRKEITEAQITELMQAIPRAEEVDRLRADNERLREENKELRETNKQLVWSIDALVGGANAEMEILRAQIGLMFLEGKP